MDTSLIAYMLIVVGLFALGYIGKQLNNKFNIKQREIQLLKLVLDVIDYITKQFEFKYDDDLSIIVIYCFEALNFIEKYEETNDLSVKKELVKERALIICNNNNIDLANGVVEIVDQIIEYIIVNYQ